MMKSNSKRRIPEEPTFCTIMDLYGLTTNTDINNDLLISKTLFQPSCWPVHHQKQVSVCSKLKPFFPHCMLNSVQSLPQQLLYTQDSQAFCPCCNLPADLVPHRSRETGQSILSVPSRPAKQLTDTHPWSQPFRLRNPRHSVGGFN